MRLQFVSYRSKYFQHRTVGLISGTTVAPCTVLGARVNSLYDLIEGWNALSPLLCPGGPVESIEDVEILAPLVGRDVLGIAKNYVDHVSEAGQRELLQPPTFPMMFTKRASSIISHGSSIYHHSEVTQELDYEGELGIIVGKGGIGIKKENAWEHVWGATIINDMSARDLQRHHKQFYIGKSLDTLCPMGPYAVHTTELDWENLILETRINGLTRQKQHTSELIFDIPTLIETCSRGITLQPGDVIATGTPSGIGSGQKPPVFLKPGDTIDVSITNLGTLSNTIASADAPIPRCEPVRIQNAPQRPLHNIRTLTSGQQLHIEVTEPHDIADSETILFIHGMWGSSSEFLPLIHTSQVRNTHRIITFDLEGHGLSPNSTRPEDISIDILADSVSHVLENVGVSKPITIIAHSMGASIAMSFAAAHHKSVGKLFLLGASSNSTIESDISNLGPDTLRLEGIALPIDELIEKGLSRVTRNTQPLVVSLVRSSIVGTRPETYVRASLALGRGSDRHYFPAISSIRTQIVVGKDDIFAPPSEAYALASNIDSAEVVVLKDVGHWAHLEACEGTARELRRFLNLDHEPSIEAAHWWSSVFKILSLT